MLQNSTADAPKIHFEGRAIRLALLNFLNLSPTQVSTTPVQAAFFFPRAQFFVPIQTLIFQVLTRFFLSLEVTVLIFPAQLAALAPSPLSDKCDSTH